MFLLKMLLMIKKFPKNESEILEYLHKKTDYLWEKIYIYIYNQVHHLV